MNWIVCTPKAGLGKHANTMRLTAKRGYSCVSSVAPKYTRGDVPHAGRAAVGEVLMGSRGRNKVQTIQQCACLNYR